MRKTHTSTAVKRRYNDKTYRRFNVSIRKDSDLIDFIESRKADGESINGTFATALELYRASLENPPKGNSEPVKGGSDE